MQTFLPYSDFDESVACLDYRRLGKQRVEAYQILRTLRNKKSGWKNHPAVLMWKGYESALSLYMNKCIIEWKRRGYNNTMKLCQITEKVKYPKWIGKEKFHASHRSNLLRKDSVFYSQYGWKEKPGMEYVWPTKEYK